MELKTLEDIDLWDNEDRFIDDNSDSIKKLLRQEAIKWIKELSHLRSGYNTADDIIKWIKHFFNITDKEI